MPKLAELFPLHYRILLRQFLLRVIDLEALSVEADVPRFLGQFAGVLIMLSLIHTLIIWSLVARAGWQIEQYLTKTMVLVAGLIVVVSWDATFPDRRDVMVLAPLPVKPRTILMAKISSSAALLGLAVLALNLAPGLMFASILGELHRSGWGFFQSSAAYWVAMIGSSLFLYCTVLTVQGITSLLLPRRLFLRLSAALQLIAFALTLAVYFLQPHLLTTAAMMLPSNHVWVAYSPSLWFFALMNQIEGNWPSSLAWMAWRAWMGLGVSVLGATVSLLLCYLRTMKKTVEEPDLLPSGRGWFRALRFGPALENAILFFSLRSLTRSRHHRVAFAFYLSLVFAIALSLLKNDLLAKKPMPLTAGFLIATIMMVALAIFGLRSVFSLPISLTANWVWRITQLSPSEKYIAATRRSLLLFAVLPVLLLSAALAYPVRPVLPVAEHLAIVAMLGWFFVELSLIGLYKVPFTCSYLPGKVNIQFVFWAGLFLLYILSFTCAKAELASLQDVGKFAWMFAGFVLIASGVWIYNRGEAKSAILYFEERPDEVLTSLGVASIRAIETAER